MGKAVAHAVPHAPQLTLSVCRLTHASDAPEPHAERPEGHTQALPEQNCPAGQTVPHAPQLFVSTVRLKQPEAPHEV